MDQSYSDRYVKLTPSPVKKRLQELRPRRLEYPESPEDSVSLLQSTEGRNKLMQTVEIIAKLNATNEILKDRLRKLKEKIETFTKENPNFKKIGGDIELESQKFNEKNVSTECNLAEENKKLKKQIDDLIEKMRAKDAKSRSTNDILRNELNISKENERKYLEEIKKLKKENSIQHSYNLTRRRTSIKHSEENNKKQNKMASKDAKLEIKQQIRSKNFFPTFKDSRVCAISLPNLNVISRYAKNCSQKDLLSAKKNKKTYLMKMTECKISYNLDDTTVKRFSNGSFETISADGQYKKIVYYNGDVKENFYNEGRMKYYYAEAKTFHTTYRDGLEVLEFPDGQLEMLCRDGSSEIRFPNGTMHYFNPKNDNRHEEYDFD